MKTDVMTIVQQLSHYLGSHPEACDTPEGIARWWIDVQAPPVPVAVVEAALGWMSACGVIEASHAADGRVRYRRRQEADDGAQRLAAMARDPQSVRPRQGPMQPPPGLH